MNEAKIEPSQLPINQVLCGDCVEVMKTFPDDIVDMTMFSPPYWGLRDYGISGQIGLEEHPSKYIEKMVEVCQEVKRVLKNAGSMYIVIGDTYYGSGVKDPSDPSHGKMTRGSFCAAAKASQAIQNKYRTNWLQPKQLMGIPWRVAIALQEDSWILRNDIIWNKPNHMPSSVKDRLSNAYEHIFHFVKSRKYYYDLDAIREKFISVKPSGNKQRKPSLQPRDSHVGRSIPWSPHKCTTEGTMLPNGARIRHGLDHSTLGSEHILGKNPSDVLLYDSKYAKHEYGQTLQAFVREQSIAKRRIESRDEAEKLFPNDPKKQQEYINYIHDHDSHSQGKNPADFWNITTQPFKGAHFAVYPEAVCIRPILSSCPEWICRKCGKPRTRMSKTIEIKPRIINGEESSLQYSSGTEGFVQTRSRMGDSIHETLGWSDCGCGAGFDSGIVLDLMCGSGTTLAVAKKLGRKYIGIELNPTYIEIANKRLAATPEKITTFF